MGLQKVRYDQAKSKLLQRSKFMKKRNDTVMIHCYYGDQNLERLFRYYLLFPRDSLRALSTRLSLRPIHDCTAGEPFH